MISPQLSLTLAQRLLREDVIDKALKRDMAHLYGVRALSELDQIFVYLCFNVGAIVEKNTLAKELQNTAAATVESHLQRLEDAHLIYRLHPFNLNGKKSLKPRSKIYIADSAKGFVLPFLIIHKFIKLGHGGIEYLSVLLDCDPKTIRQGQADLKQLPPVPRERCRKKGADENT